MDWEQLAIAGAVVVLTLVAARVVDARMRGRTLEPGAETRYRVLRRTITSVIVTVGVSRRC